MPVVADGHVRGKRGGAVAAALLILALLVVMVWLAPIVREIEFGQGRFSIAGVWRPEPDYRDCFDNEALMVALHCQRGMRTYSADILPIGGFGASARLGSLSWAVVWDREP